MFKDSLDKRVDKNRVVSVGEVTLTAGATTTTTTTATSTTATARAIARVGGIFVAGLDAGLSNRCLHWWCSDICCY